MMTPWWVDLRASEILEHFVRSLVWITILCLNMQGGCTQGTMFPDKESNLTRLQRMIRLRSDTQFIVGKNRKKNGLILTGNLLMPTMVSKKILLRQRSWSRVVILTKSGKYCRLRSLMRKPYRKLWKMKTSPAT